MHDCLLEKDNSIVIWRIFFAYAIMVFHFMNAYGKGSSLYLATDFFFIVSGFLIAKEAYEGKYKTAAEMLKQKVKRYYPHYILSFIIGFVVFTVIKKGPQVSATDFISEAGFIQMIGLNLKHMVNVPTWYLSVLLICGYIIYFLCQNHRKTYIELIAPCLIVIILTWFYRNYGYISHSSLGAEITTGIYWNRPVLIGISMMSIGAVMFEYYRHHCKLNRAIASENVENKGILQNGGVFHKTIKRALECLILCSFPALAVVFRFTSFDFVIVALMVIGVYLGFSNGGSLLARNRVIKYFSRLSFPLYLNHNMFREIIPYYCKDYSVLVLIAYLVVVTLYSMLTLFCIDSITKHFNTRKGRIKNG